MREKGDKTMTRGKFCAYSSHLTAKRIRDLVTIINAGDLSVLNNIDMPTRICQQKYLEDMTDEVRNVTVIEIGCPVQAEVCFYL